MIIEKICQTCNIRFKPGPGCKGICCSATCAKNAHIPKCCSLLTGREISAAKLNEHHETALRYKKNCLFCNAEIYSRDNKFCGHSCSATFNNKKKGKKQNNPKYKKFRADADYTAVFFNTCTICNANFVHSKKRTYCSDVCFLTIKRKNAAGTKKTVYNGFTFDSKWEVRAAQTLDELNIKWVQPTTAINWIDSTGKNRKYFPDFYLPDFNVYLDPKNKLVVQQQKEKLDYVSKRINLVYGNVDYVIDYVKSL